METGPPPPKRAKLEIQSTTAIMDLNEDVLLELFERLPVADLITMAEVNQRLKMLAEKVFRLNHGNLLMSSVGRPWRLTKLRQLLFNFGRYLNEFVVDANDISKPWQYGKMVELIMKYFRDQRTTLVLLNQRTDTIENSIATNKYNLFRITAPLRMLQLGN